VAQSHENGEMHEQIDRDNLRLMAEKREAGIALGRCQAHNEELQEQLLEQGQQLALLVVRCEHLQHHADEPAVLYTRYTCAKMFGRIRLRLRLEALGDALSSWLHRMWSRSRKELRGILVDHQMRFARARMRSAMARLVRQEWQAEYAVAKSCIICWRRQQRLNAFQPSLA